MKRKGMIAAALTVGMLISAGTQVMAASRDVITFDGNAREFVTQISGDLENGFEEMLPGETRTLNLEVKNEASEELKFFLSSDILKTDLAEQGDRKAVYDFQIKRDQEPFFQAVLGGEEEQNVSAGKEYLMDDSSILLAQLEKGESTDLQIAISLDGDSMGNEYMNASGSMELRFRAETPDAPGKLETPKQTWNKVVQSIKTGDALKWAAPMAMAISSLVLGWAILRKKKSRTEE